MNPLWSAPVAISVGADTWGRTPGAGLQAAADRARATVAAAEPDQLARLHALADAYLAFIRDHPHVHDLAYGPAVAKSDHPLLQHAAIAYWDLLHDTVASCQPAGTIRPAQVGSRRRHPNGDAYFWARRTLV
jgi:hypothetical protein